MFQAASTSVPTGIVVSTPVKRARGAANSNASSSQRWTDSQAEYERKKLAGECLWCDREAEDDSAYCSEHGPRVREIRKRSQRKRRAKLRLAKRCSWCSRPSTLSVCHECRPRKTGAVNNAVDNRPPPKRPRSAAIAARTTRSLEAYGDDKNNHYARSRFHGRARRGPPTKLELVEYDKRAIEDELARAHADFARFYSPEVQQLPRIQRDAVKAEAVGHLNLALRFLEALVDEVE